MQPGTASTPKLQHAEGWGGDCEQERVPGSDAGPGPQSLTSALQSAMQNRVTWAYQKQHVAKFVFKELGLLWSSLVSCFPDTFFVLVSCLVNTAACILRQPLWEESLRSSDF